MTSVGARTSRGGRRKQSRKPTTESRKPSGKHREAGKSPPSEGRGLEAAELDVLIEDLRGIEHVLGTASPLVEQARQIAFTMICDHPEQRDALARLGHRLTGGDIDRFGPHNLRLIDDDLLDGVIQAADSVIDAALWRLDRLRCVLVRCAESQQVNPPESASQQ